MGKHYSLGLDLEWLAGLPMLELTRFTNGMQKLLARVLTFPMVTVAALNGDIAMPCVCPMGEAL